MNLSTLINGHSRLRLTEDREVEIQVQSIDGEFNRNSPTYVVCYTDNEPVWSVEVTGIMDNPTSDFSTSQRRDYYGYVWHAGSAIVIAGDPLFYVLDMESGTIVNSGDLAFTYKDALDILKAVDVGGIKLVVACTRRVYILGLSGTTDQIIEPGGLVQEVRPTDNGAIVMSLYEPNDIEPGLKEVYIRV